MKYVCDHHWCQTKDTAITLGNFDGLHMGHQKLIEMVKDYGEKFGLQTMVFSFYPHPLSILQGHTFRTICSSQEKKWLMEQMDVDIFLEYPFDKTFCNIEPEDFVEQILIQKMRCKVLVVGEGYRFGKNRKGSGALLKELGAKFGIMVTIVPNITMKEVKVSSSSIREYILQKRFREAEKLLTRPYFVRGSVVRGNQNGRMINFPTANLIPPQEKLLPSHGVYLTRTIYNNRCINGVTNVGVNPTIGGKSITVETFLFNFDGEIYNQVIMVYFYKWIRDEKKFDSIDALKAQIEKDIAIIDRFFR